MVVRRSRAHSFAPGPAAIDASRRQCQEDHIHVAAVSVSGPGRVRVRGTETPSGQGPSSTTAGNLTIAGIVISSMILSDTGLSIFVVKSPFGLQFFNLQKLPVCRLNPAWDSPQGMRKNSIASGSAAHRHQSGSCSRALAFEEFLNAFLEFFGRLFIRSAGQVPPTRQSSLNVICSIRSNWMAISKRMDVPG